MKKNARPKSRNTKAEVQSKRKASAKKHFALSKYLPKNKRTVGKIIFASLLLVLIGGAIPFPYTYAKDDEISFTTENQKLADLELGESKTIQEGRNGKKTVNIEAYQSLWGRLLGLAPMNQKESSSTVTSEATAKIIGDGTRKYQYMFCSNGSYRYYPDDEFKDENTGFTSKSDDYCKQEGQGEMTQLSDTPPGQASASNARQPTVTERDGCTYTSIPYKTVYRDVAWLNKGETRVSKGSDGTKSSCGWSTEPKDEEILRGTSEPSSGFNPPPNTGNQNAAAYQQCFNSYNSAMSQIQASISQGMSGQEALKRQVETEFARCKRAAGY